jgi:alpha-tubulin suppressor-like RCC1 family protein
MHKLDYETLDGETLRKQAKMIACGPYHMAFVHNGQVLTWGEDGLAAGHGEVAVPVPTQIAELCTIPIVQASVGEGHTLFLTADGKLFACGDNTFGQLGLGDQHDRSKPTFVKAPLAQQVAAGDGHGVLLAKDGLVYTWGSERDKLGYMKRPLDSRQLTPRVIGDDIRYVGVVACRNLTAMIGPGGSMSMFGVNDGQLRSPVIPAILWTPTVIDVLDKYHVVEIALGPRHILVRTRCGKVVMLGNEINASGIAVLQLPQSDDKVTNIATGTSYNMLLLATGKVYVHDLARDLTQGEWYDLGVDDVVAIGCGEKVKFAIDGNGQRLAWTKSPASVRQIMP